MENPGQAGSLGAHAETNRAVCSAQGRGSRAVAPALTSKIYDTVDESVAEPAACWGKARPLQPPAQPYAREYHSASVALRYVAALGQPVFAEALEEHPPDLRFLFGVPLSGSY